MVITLSESEYGTQTMRGEVITGGAGLILCNLHHFSYIHAVAHDHASVLPPWELFERKRASELERERARWPHST